MRFFYNLVVAIFWATLCHKRLVTNFTTVFPLTVYKVD